MAVVEAGAAGSGSEHLGREAELELARRPATAVMFQIDEYPEEYGGNRVLSTTRLRLPKLRIRRFQIRAETK